MNAEKTIEQRIETLAKKLGVSYDIVGQSEEALKKQYELLQDIEEAQARSKELQKVINADISVDGQWEDPRRDIVKRYAPYAYIWSDNKTLAKKATHTPYFDAPRYTKSLVASGYRPIINNGRHVSDGDDVLFVREKAFYRASIKSSSKRSRERLKAKTEYSKDMNYETTELGE